MEITLDGVALSEKDVATMKADALAAYTANLAAVAERQPEIEELPEHDSRHPASGYVHPAPITIRRGLDGPVETREGEK